jgi:hypothetical protein
MTALDPHQRVAREQLARDRIDLGQRRDLVNGREHVSRDGIPRGPAENLRQRQRAAPV